MNIANLFCGPVHLGKDLVGLPLVLKPTFGFICVLLPGALPCDTSRGSPGLLLSCSEEDATFSCCAEASLAALCSSFAASGMFGVSVGYKVRLAKIAQIIQESYQEEDDNHLISPRPVKPFG